MRIAVLTHYFPTSANPWAGHSAYQTLRLLARRCNLQVFYPYSTYPAGLTPPGRRADILDPEWGPGDVEVAYLPYPALPFLTRSMNGHTIARRLLPHIRQWQPDIILNYVVYPNGYAAVRIGEALDVPVVLTAIGSDLNRIADPICEVFTRVALRRATVVTAVSQNLCQTARRLGAHPERSIAILNGCDTTLFHPESRNAARTKLQLDTEDEIVLYVGRLDLRKGLLELIEALAQLLPRRSRLRCFIMGDGPDKSVLLDAVSRHNLSQQIHFVPSDVSPKVALWMAAANLVTLPSYNEGCPNVVIEALSSGRPVVATRVGGIPELMDDTCGRLVPARDVPALCQALDEALRVNWSPTDISSIHSRGWQDVESDLYGVLEQAVHSYKNGNQPHPLDKSNGLRTSKHVSS